MFCPRCGSQNTETTKFCRQCGLALAEVMNYVTTGGTSGLIPPPPSSGPVSALASFTPKQKMWMSILCLIFMPAMAAVMTEPFGIEEFVVPIFGLLMTIGIPFVVIYFRNQAKLLEHVQPQAIIPPQPQMYAPPQPQAYLQAPVMPVSDPNAVPLRAGHNTNPLGQAPPSVVEDETKRFNH